MDIGYLLFLQEVRESLPDVFGAFFMLLSDLTNSAAIIAIPCIIYWCLDKRKGALVLFSFSMGSFVNCLIKVTVCQPRPWMRDARIQPYGNAIESATGYSFPSGHTQSAASILGPLGWSYREKRRWAFPLCCFLILLVGFSRNVLGVHTPQDVLVGMVVGMVFAAVAHALLDWAEQAPGRDAVLAAWACAIAVLGCLYVALKPYPEGVMGLTESIDTREMALDCYQATGLFLGGFVSWWAERNWLGFEVGTCNLRKGAIRVLVGVLMIVAFRYGLTLPLKEFAPAEVFDFAKGLLTTVAVVLAGPWAFTALERRLEAAPSSR